MRQCWLIVLFFLVLTSCDSGTNHAPVIDINKSEPRAEKVIGPPVMQDPALSTLVNTSEQINTKEPEFALSTWFWPAKGRVVNAFSANNNGIDIAGQSGDPVYAAAPGKVVYSGGGLRGYGNLIILKHNNLYLSAYAHNSLLFVKEGDWVTQGQKIAEMGNSGSDKVMLHFEIRRSGQPIDPAMVSYSAHS